MCNIKLEPYIVIPTNYINFEKTIKTCGEHETFNWDKYCSKCGKKIIEKKVITKRNLCAYDLLGCENLAHYFIGEFMYLFSNKIEYIQHQYQTNIFEINVDIIDDMKEQFVNHHKDDIATLEKRIGSKIDVKFGYLYLD